MAVKIKLARLGKIRNPQYRVIIADSRTRRNGRAIETIGTYVPKNEPSIIEINSERAQHWLNIGAQPTDPVLQLLKITGDWQKYKGLPGTEGTLKPQPVKPNKLDLFNKALAEAENAVLPEATTERRKKKKAEPVAEESNETSEVAEDVVVQDAPEVPEEAVAEVNPESTEVEK